MTLKSNAEELAVIAQGAGAEVVRGPVRYPGELRDVDLGIDNLEKLEHATVLLHKSFEKNRRE